MIGSLLSIIIIPHACTALSLYQCISRSVLLVLVQDWLLLTVICNNYSGEYTIKMMCGIFIQKVRDLPQ